LLKAPACLSFSSSGCPELCFGTCPEQFKQPDSYLLPKKLGIPLLKSPGGLKPANILNKTPNAHPDGSLENDLWVSFQNRQWRRICHPPFIQYSRWYSVVKPFA